MLTSAWEHLSGVAPMGSGWANPWAPWLRGHPSLRITALSWVVPEITPPGNSIPLLSHRHPRASWHKVMPLEHLTFLCNSCKCNDDTCTMVGKMEIWEVSSWEMLVYGGKYWNLKGNCVFLYMETHRILWKFCSLPRKRAFFQPCIMQSDSFVCA